MNLQSVLKDYKKITLELIESINDTDIIEDLIIKRQEIIDCISSSTFQENEFKEIVESLNLIEIENNLIDKMKKECVNTKRALENVKRLKKARSLYNKESSNPVFFNMTSY